MASIVEDDRSDVGVNVSANRLQGRLTHSNDLDTAAENPLYDDHPAFSRCPQMSSPHETDIDSDLQQARATRVRSPSPHTPPGTPRQIHPLTTRHRNYHLWLGIIVYIRSALSLTVTGIATT